MQTEYRCEIEPYWSPKELEDIVERNRIRDEERKQRERDIAKMPTQGDTEAERDFWDWQKEFFN